MSTVPKNPGILSNLRIHGILRTGIKKNKKLKAKRIYSMRLRQKIL